MFIEYRLRRAISVYSLFLINWFTINQKNFISIFRHASGVFKKSNFVRSEIKSMKKNTQLF